MVDYGDTYGNLLGIKWDGFKKGHTLNDRLKGEDAYTGWNVRTPALKLVKRKAQEKLVIYVEDKKVKCKYINAGKTVDETIATCAPDDTFDFLTGAQIALQRLLKSKDAPVIINADTPVGKIKTEKF